MAEQPPRIAPARYPWHEQEEGTCPICYPYGNSSSPHPKVVMNDRWQSVAQLKEALALTPEQSLAFDRLNPQLLNWPMAMIYPGELLLVGNPEGGCRHELDEQIKILRDVRRTLSENDAPTDDFLIRNHALLSQILGYAALYPGLIADSWSAYLKQIAQTMKEIEAIHHLHLKPRGDGNLDLFHEKRARLFKKLDSQLQGIGRLMTKLRKERYIKDVLEISTKSFQKKGYIKGYAEKLNSVNRAAKIMKHGGYLGMVITSGNTVLDIRKACALGREEHCRRAKIVQTSKLGGNLILGAGFAAVMPVICVVVGAPTAGVGTAVCGVAMSALGAWSGGKAGDVLGENAGELIYESVYE